MAKRNLECRIESGRLTGRTLALPTKIDIAEQEVTVETDLVRVKLSSRGGVVKSWELKRYHTQEDKTKEIQLVPSDTTGATLVPPLTLQVADPKLQQRIAKGLYQVSTTNLRLSVTQPIGEIDFSYSDPETGARATSGSLLPTGITCGPPCSD